MPTINAKQQATSVAFVPSFSSTTTHTTSPSMFVFGGADGALVSFAGKIETRAGPVAAAVGLASGGIEKGPLFQPNSDGPDIVSCNSDGSVHLALFPSAKTLSSLMLPSGMAATCASLINFNGNAAVAVGDVGGAVSIIGVGGALFQVSQASPNREILAISQTSLLSRSSGTNKSSNAILLVSTAASPPSIQCVNSCSKVEFSIPTPSIASDIVCSLTAIYVACGSTLFTIDPATNSLCETKSFSSPITCLSLAPSFSEARDSLLIGLQDCNVHFLDIESMQANPLTLQHPASSWPTQICVGSLNDKEFNSKGKPIDRNTVAIVFADGTKSIQNFSVQPTPAGGPAGSFGNIPEGKRKRLLGVFPQDEMGAAALDERRRVAVFEAVVRVARGDDEKFTWVEEAGPAVVSNARGGRGPKRKAVEVAAVVDAPMKVEPATKILKVDDDEEDGEILE
ncbi:hypothetical protein HDU98_009673 [Podochytrium sp. JEL0797]|nr:hypothetical protein HDU98_009673 [Podochytrium sp. JEL0797]